MFSWFNKLKLGAKIGLGYGIVVCIMILSSVINLIQMQKLEDINALRKSANDMMFLSDAAYTEYLSMEVAHLQYLIGMKDHSLTVYYETEKNFRENIKKIDTASSEKRENHERLATALKLFEEQYALNNASIVLIKKGEQDKALKTEQEGILKGLTSNIKEQFKLITDNEIKSIESLRLGRDAIMQRLIFTSIAGALSAIIIAILLALFITRSVVTTVGSAISAIAATSSEMAATINEHEKVASQQAASVNETTSTMNELDVTFSQTANKVGETAESANKASDIADDGAKTVQLSMNTMAVLKDKVASVAEQILRLSEQTNQISSITGLVSDLANQTNLLALNAAVEAARAGEHGKGFAVVASEIRKLADQSKKSAEKINIVVADIQKATNSTVMATEEGTKNVDLSINAARKTAEAFNELASFISTTFDMSQQTVFTVKQQVAAVKQVVEAMNAINAGVKETASGLSQTRVGIQKLNETATALKSIV
ncbi:hypothetical protein MASR1M107_26170 [Ignavibacteriales bacterium]